MPQGGGATSTSDTAHAGTSANSQLFRQIREGTSWSGNEQNTIFLNAGAETHFMDVSAAAQFDFQDDGRGMTPVDWDADGDLDIITSNRNGPQLRFLRNDVPVGQNQSVGIFLQGTGKVNRDAIGARVTIVLADQPPVVQTLRAGDGFQSQNTKWLHFGLGKDPVIENVIVHWPGGAEQTFDQIQPGKRYRCVCGDAQAKLEVPPKMKWPSPLPKLTSPEVVSGGRALTASRLPMPRLKYMTFEGSPATFEPGKSGKLTLVNLWASWCGPCLAELKEFQHETARLQEAGIEVLALSLEGVGSNPGKNESAKKFIAQFDGAIKSGVATNEILQKITLLHDLVFEKRGPVALPTSLLIDEQGRLAGYFEGPLTVNELLEHAENARLKDSSKSLAAAVPFDGKWLVEPVGFRLADYGKQLLKFGYIKDAQSIYDRAEKVFAIDPDQYLFVAQLGLAFESRGDLKTAVQYMAHAVKLKPDNAMAHIGLGDRYTKLGQFSQAVVSYQSALKLDPSQTQARYNMAILLKRIGRTDVAFKQFQILVKDDPKHALAHANIAAVLMEQKKIPESIIHLDAALKAKPDFHQVRFQLGLLLEQDGKPEAAKKHYQHLLKINPSYAPALRRMAELNK